MISRTLVGACLIFSVCIGCDGGDSNSATDAGLDVSPSYDGGQVDGSSVLDAAASIDVSNTTDTSLRDSSRSAQDSSPPAVDAGSLPPDARITGPDAATVDAASLVMPREIIEDAGEELALLFVGNSYVNSNNLQNIVCDLARQTERWASVRCERVTAGGKRLNQHESDAAAGQRLGQWLDPNNADRPQWDAVILQEQSQIPGFPEGNAELLASRQAVADLDARVAAIGAQTALMMTWGRRDGDNRNPQLYPDYLTMQSRLAAGYEAAANAASTSDRTVHVIPVGRAWQQTWMRDPEGDFRALYSGDGSHPAFPGSWLSAAVLLNHLVSLSPDDASPTNRGPEMDQLLRLREDVRAVSPQAE